jgi:hypothetical protein
MGYRDNAFFCPGCSAAMEERPTAEALIDVCPQCGGVYLDWFDGEPQVALAGWAPQPHSRHPVQRLTGHCPKCGGGFEGEELGGTGAMIFRCTGCMGFYATEDAARMIAGYTEPLPSEAPSFWARLIETMRILFDVKA